VPDPSRFTTRAEAAWRPALAAIIAVAAVLRLIALNATPPGLNQDEAVNAWNAWCLLKTGTDQTGAPWPLFSYRALGEHRSTLFLYALLPFQLLGGLNIWTTRLPAAAAALLTVALTAWVGRRMFDPATGLVAAAILAVNPTHLQMSRWGHEASITPLLCLLPLAAIFWTGLPLADRPAQPNLSRALIAGLASAACCYGYPAVRLFVPPVLLAVLLLTLPVWWQLRRGRAAAFCFALGFAVLFFPLAYKHLAEPEVIGRRGRMTWLWTPSDPLPVRARNVLNRYLGHFRFDFLFKSGDADEVAWAAGFGFLPAYLLPAQLAGLGALSLQVRRRLSARILAATVALYPAGDCLNWHISLHGLRSSAGLVPLLLLAALGLAHAASCLYRLRLHATLLTLASTFIVCALVSTGRFASSYVVDRPRQLAVYHGNHVDLLEAIHWLKPQLDPADRVICTQLGMNQPYLIVLTALKYSPHRWFAEPREFRTDGSWDRCVRFGNFYFLHEWERPAVMQELTQSPAIPRIWLILRPGQTPAGTPAHRIIGPDGHPALLIYRLEAPPPARLSSCLSPATFHDV
jgi:4-amino-4-deoxy-L-arabinose transferase-like glycosyltransferase